MSENSESGSEESTRYANGKDQDDICRDYLRNVCKRGRRCKYRHPNPDEARNLGRKQDITICHDFQNTGCRRQNCKFLHITREEEEHFKQTGQLPVRLQQAAALGMGAPPSVDIPLLRGEVPICKDNLKGNCKRGNKCKYRHVGLDDYEREKRHDQRNSKMYDPYDESDRYEGYEGFSGKRRRTERDFDGYNGFDTRYPIPARPYSYQLLEEENAMLRRKVDELKKQVADLTATNEVLLEQNARYRVSRPNVQALNGVAAQPPQSLNHLATSLAQQIALNSELVNQHALQQRLAREMANGPGNLPLNVPVSLPQNNMSMSAVSMHQGGGGAGLVSYPIVSQGMRSKGIPNSLGPLAS